MAPRHGYPSVRSRVREDENTELPHALAPRPCRIHRYTLLPPTQERCLATEMQLEWTYTAGREEPNYEAERRAVRDNMLKGFYGPNQGGVYSKSLQATIYDACAAPACHLPAHLPGLPQRACACILPVPTG
jgi:hypothetical protein